MASVQAASIPERHAAFEKKVRRLCRSQRDLNTETKALRKEMTELSYHIDSAQWRYMNICPYLHPVFRLAGQQKRPVQVAELSEALNIYDKDRADAISRKKNPPHHAPQGEGMEKAKQQQRQSSDFREGQPNATVQDGRPSHIRSEVSEISGQAKRQNQPKQSANKGGSRDPNFVTTSGALLPAAVAAKLRAEKAAALVRNPNHTPIRPDSAVHPVKNRGENVTVHIPEHRQSGNVGAKDVFDADHESNIETDDDDSSSSTEYDSEGWALPLREEPPMPSREQAKAARSHPNIRRVWGASNRWLNSKYRLEEKRPCSTCRTRKKGAFPCYKWHPHARRVACVRCYLTQQTCSFMSDAAEQGARTIPRNTPSKPKSNSASTFAQASKRPRSASLGLPREINRSKWALSVVPGSTAEFMTAAAGRNISRHKTQSAVAASLETLKKQLADAREEHKELNRHVLEAIRKQEQEWAASMQQAWKQVNNLVGGTANLGKQLQQQQQDLTNILKGLRSACGALSDERHTTGQLATSLHSTNILSRPDCSTSSFDGHVDGHVLSDEGSGNRAERDFNRNTADQLRCS